MKNKHKEYQVTILAAVILTAAFFILYLIFNLLFEVLLKSKASVTLIDLISYASAISICIIYLYIIKKTPIFSSKKAEITNPKVILLIILFSVGLHLFFDPFNNIRIIKELYLQKTLIPHERMIEKSFLTELFSYITILLISPFAEELFFRNFIFLGMKRKYNKKIAIIISSLLFSVIHFANPINILITFIFGVLLASIIDVYYNVWLVIIIHFTYNLIYSVKALISDFYWEILSSLRFNIVYWLVWLIGIIILVVSYRKLKQIVIVIDTEINVQIK